MVTKVWVLAGLRMGCSWVGFGSWFAWAWGPCFMFRVWVFMVRVWVMGLPAHGHVGVLGFGCVVRV